MLGVLAALVLTAQEPATTGYEDQLIQWGLKQQGRELEPDPAGKPIEEVLYSIEDVFSATDPWPGFLNIFHWTSKEMVVSREVLLAQGQTWDAAKAAETERNLRLLVVFAVAKVVPVKGRLGGVAVLVITKDRWSLRAEWNYLVVGNVLEYLEVPVTEINLLGRGMQLTIDPYLRRDTLSLGESFVNPRVFSSSVMVSESASLIFNRATGKPEGTAGVLEIARPLRNLAQTWGFDAFATWDVRRARIYRGNDIWQLGFPSDDAPSAVVPYIYDARNIEADALITKSIGSVGWKLNLTGGLGGYTRLYAPPPGSNLAPDVQAWFIKNWLPRSEDATYLYAAAHLYQLDFQQLHDLESFALTEDVRMGPSVRAGLKGAFPSPLASSLFLEAGASVVYRVLLGQDLLSLSVGAAARFISNGAPVNQHYAFEAANYSPPFEGGRFVMRVMGDFWVHDLDNHQELLGGGSGLRGAAPEEFTGHNLVLGNFEYRTRPFVIQTVHVGFVLFYDVGSAFDVSPALTHTVGLGMRILLPQLNQDVIRLDFGFVLSSDAAISASNFSSSFGQVTAINSALFFEDPI